MKTGMSAMLALVNASEIEYNKMAEAIDNSTGATKTMAEVMRDNLGADIELLKSSLEGLGISFGETLAPMLRNAIQGLTNFINKMAQMSEGSKKALIGIVGFGLGLGAVLSVLGKVTSGIGGMLMMFSNLTIALGTTGMGLGATLSALGGLLAPIVPWILGIAAAVGVLWIAWKSNFGNIREYTASIFNSLGSIFNTFKELMTTVGDVIKKAWDGNFLYLKDIATGIYDLFDGVFGELLSTVDNLLKGIDNLLKGDFSGAFENFKSAFLDIFLDIPTAISEARKSIGTALFNMMKEIGIGLGEALLSAGGYIYENAKKLLDNITKSVDDNMDNISGKIKESIKNAFINALNDMGLDGNLIWDNLSGAFDSVVTGVEGIFIRIKEIASTAVTNIFGNGELNAIASQISEVFNIVVNSIGNFFSQIGYHISEGWGQITNFFSLGIDTIGATISEKWTALGNVIFGAAGEAWSALISEDWEGFKTIISNAITDIGVIISSGWDSIIGTISTMFENIGGVVSEKWGYITEVFNSTTGFISEIVSTKFSEIYTAISDYMSQAWNYISLAWQTIWATIENTCSSIWSSVSTYFSNIYTEISNKLEQARSSAETSFNNIKNAIVTIASGIVSDVSSFFSNIASTIGSKLNEAKTAGVNAFNQLATGIASVISGIISSISTFCSNIVSKISGLGSSLFSAGKSAISQLLSGFTSGFQSVYNAIGGFISTVNSKLSGIGSKVSGVIGGIKNTIMGQSLDNIETDIGVNVNYSTEQQPSAPTIDTYSMQPQATPSVTPMSSPSESTPSVSPMDSSSGGSSTSSSPSVSTFASFTDAWDKDPYEGMSDEAKKEAQARVQAEKDANSAILKLRNELVKGLKNKIQEQKEQEMSIYNARIEAIKKEMALLDDSVSEKPIDKLKEEQEQLVEYQDVLSQLQAEKDKWAKNDSAISKQRQKELDEQIAEQQKKIAEQQKNVSKAQVDVEKERLQEQIDIIEQEKQASEEKFDKLLTDEALYTEANKMMQEGNMKEIMDLMTKYNADWENIGLLWGKSLAEAMKEEIQKGLDAMDYIKDNKKPTTPPSSGGSSSGSSSSNSSSNSGSSSSDTSSLGKGSKVKIEDINATIYRDSYTSKSSGTVKGAGIQSGDGLYIVNENNGKVALARDNNINNALFWLEKSKIKKFHTGGIFNGLKSDEGFATLQSGERVLDRTQTSAFDTLVYDWIPKLENMFKNISTSNSYATTNGLTYNSVYNIQNKCDFDERNMEDNIIYNLKKQMKNMGKKF